MYNSAGFFLVIVSLLGLLIITLLMLIPSATRVLVIVLITLILTLVAISALLLVAGLYTYTSNSIYMSIGRSSRASNQIQG